MQAGQVDSIAWDKGPCFTSRQQACSQHPSFDETMEGHGGQVVVKYTDSVCAWDKARGPML